MPTITIPTKTTGDNLSASEVNIIVAGINSKQDQLNIVNNLTTSFDNTVLDGRQGLAIKTLLDLLSVNKEPLITATTSLQYFRGDKTFATLNLDIVPDGTTNKAYTVTEKTKLAALVNYILPIATNTVLGGVKQGTNITIANDGTISSTGGSSTTDASLLTSGTLNDSRLSSNIVLLTNLQTLTNKTISGASNTISNIAQSSITGLVSDLSNKQATLVSGTTIKTINGVSILGTGDLTISGGTAYTLPTASSTVLGGVKIGTNITIDGSGVISSALTTDASTLTTGTLADARLSTNIVKLTGAQTLLNKTLTSPSITTPTGIIKSDVGLANVDNTSDANKPISTATSTALSGKQATLVSGTTIKTVNGNSLLGSGDLVISGGSGTAYTVTTLTRAAIQSAIDAVTSGIITLSPGTYSGFDGTSLNFAGKTNLTIQGFGAANLSTNQGTILTLNGNNVKSRITGINFICTGTSGGGNGLISINELGTDNGLEIDHCAFTSPTYRSNGISMSAYSATADGGSGQGKLKQDIKINHNRFISLGRMGIELINHTWNDSLTTVYIKNVQVDHNYFNDLGKVAEADGTTYNGMAFSNSGYAYDIKVTDNEVIDPKLLGIELAGSEKAIVANNTIDYINNSFTGISISDNSHNATKYITIIGNNVRSKTTCITINQVKEFNISGNSFIQGVSNSANYAVYFQNSVGGSLSGGIINGFCFNPVRLDDSSKVIIGGGIRIQNLDTNNYSLVSIFGTTGGLGSTYNYVTTDVMFEKSNGIATSGVVEAFGTTATNNTGVR